jgi:hypothetical protein
MKITKVTNFRQAIIIPTMSKQYHTKTMWKFATFHMIIGKSIQSHTWSHIKLVKYLKKITKVTYLRQAIIITTMYNQHLAKSMWKYASFHMVLGI